jgi:hypothetical protein
LAGGEFPGQRREPRFHPSPWSAKGHELCSLQLAKEPNLTSGKITSQRLLPYWIERIELKSKDEPST